MSCFHLLRFATGLCSLSLLLHAQMDDWHSVEKLSPRTNISVVKRGRRGCALVGVTESKLTCEQDRTLRTLVFTREQVREVRLEDLDHNRLIAGAIVGGILGGVVGFALAAQTHDPEGRGYSRAYGIPIGAFFGGLIGRDFFHRHGAVIYRPN